MTEPNRQRPSDDGGGRLIAAGLTDPGKVRDHNEDAFAIHDDLGLYIVSDGMGGAQAGELASSVVIQGLPVEVAARLLDADTTDDEQMAECLRASLEDLSLQLYDQSQQVERLRGMGATVVACLIRDAVAVVAHMGDSRVYLMRRGALQRLTEDHALVDVLLKMGQITKAEARTHPGRNVVTRYVGMEADVGPDVGLLELEKGDQLLLCTDGLTKMVPERAIADVLSNEPDIDAACERLVQAANDAGGEDNITVLLIRNGDAPDADGKEHKVVVRRVVGRSLKKIEAEPEGLAEEAPAMLKPMKKVL